MCAPVQSLRVKVAVALGRVSADASVDCDWPALVRLASGSTQAVGETQYRFAHPAERALAVAIMQLPDVVQVCVMTAADDSLVVGDATALFSKSHETIATASCAVNVGQCWLC